MCVCGYVCACVYVCILIFDWTTALLLVTITITTVAMTTTCIHEQIRG